MYVLRHINKIKVSSSKGIRNLKVISRDNYLPIFPPGYSWSWPVSNNIKLFAGQEVHVEKNCVLSIEHDPNLNFPIWSILWVWMGKSCTIIFLTCSLAVVIEGQSYPRCGLGGLGVYGLGRVRSRKIINMHNGQVNDVAYCDNLGKKCVLPYTNEVSSQCPAS